MPRRHRRDAPRWRRGRHVTVRPVQLSGRRPASRPRVRPRHRRAARHGERHAGRDGRVAVPPSPRPVRVAGCHPGGGCHPACHPPPGPVRRHRGSAAAGALLVWATRHLSRFARRATELAAVVTLAWLPALTAAGFARPGARAARCHLGPVHRAVGAALRLASRLTRRPGRTSLTPGPTRPSGSGSRNAASGPASSARSSRSPAAGSTRSSSTARRPTSGRSSPSRAPWPPRGTSRRPRRTPSRTRPASSPAAT